MIPPIHIHDQTQRSRNQAVYCRPETPAMKGAVAGGIQVLGQSGLHNKSKANLCNLLRPYLKIRI